MYAAYSNREHVPSALHARIAVGIKQSPNQAFPKTDLYFENAAPEPLRCQGWTVSSVKPHITDHFFIMTRRL